MTVFLARDYRKVEKQRKRMVEMLARMCSTVQELSYLCGNTKISFTEEDWEHYKTLMPEDEAEDDGHR